MTSHSPLIILASGRQEAFEAFKAGAEKAGARFALARTGAAALALAAARAPALVAADEGLPDFTALELVYKLLGIDANIQAAVVSSLPEEEFHAKSEGLGVLARLPQFPGERDGRELMAKLDSLRNPGTAG
jgi:DNA-binding response OmpR family regulator